MKNLSKLLVIFFTLICSNLFAQKKEYLESFLLVVPTGKYNSVEFTEEINSLNQHLQVKLINFPKDKTFSISGATRFSKVYKNLIQVREIMQQNLSKEQVQISVRYVNQEVIYTYLDDKDDDTIVMISENSINLPPKGIINQKYKVNGQLVLDNSGDYHFKEVEVHGTLVIDGQKSYSFETLVIKGNMVIKSNSICKVKTLIIEGDVVIKENANINVNTVFMKSGDVLLDGKNANLLVTNEPYSHGANILSGKSSN